MSEQTCGYKCLSTFRSLFYALAYCVLQIHMASRKRPRLQCPLCKETLSYSAYCRHQQTQLCIPDKRCQSSQSQPQNKEIEGSFNSTDIDDITNGNDYQDSEQFINDVSLSSQSSSDESNDSAPEIWDIESEMTSNDSTEPLPTTNINYILSYFLLFFQLCYRTRTKFRGLNFRLKISNYFRGSLFLWGVNFRGCTQYFALKNPSKYCARVCILKLTFQWFLAPSMPPKRDVSTQNLPWLPSTDLRLNTDTNILEPIVNRCQVITDRVTWSR